MARHDFVQVRQMGSLTLITRLAMGVGSLFGDVSFPDLSLPDSSLPDLHPRVTVVTRPRLRRALRRVIIKVYGQISSNRRSRLYWVIADARAARARGLRARCRQLCHRTARKPDRSS